MIQIINKAKCCGCTACYSVCPKNCISMKEDAEGFFYPSVSIENCINCHACEKVCPYVHTEGIKKSESLLAAVQYKDEKKRMQSSAGGAFSLIADYLLEKGAIIYAVGYDDNCVVCHKKAEKQEQISEFRGSKYVQSNLNGCFREIKQYINNGNQVLFVGTPCQVHGLINYVGKHDLLYTIDLLCLGVTSPGLFKKYIEYLNCKYKKTVKSIQFRNKKYGYGIPNIRIYFSDDSFIEQKYDSMVHGNLFFKEFYNVRPSCYNCTFRIKPRVSDFTIGDFVNIGTVYADFDDNKGTTKLWCHSEKGHQLFETIKDRALVKTIEGKTENITDKNEKKIIAPKNREQFFIDSNKLSYHELITKWEPQSIQFFLTIMINALLSKFSSGYKVINFLRNLKNKRKYL